MGSFVTVESVVTHYPGSQSPEVEEPRLPLVTLGHGRARLFDKKQARVHQAWLAYGPSLHTLKRASAMVRQCLTDMGAGFGVVDVVDVTRQRIRCPSPPRNGEHIYPNAMQVFGPQHILDTIL